MRTNILTLAAKIKVGFVAAIAVTLLMTSCGSGHDVCPAYQGYHKKHRVNTESAIAIDALENVNR